VKFLVLGAGRQGYAVAYDLIRSPRVEQVIIADKDANRVKQLADMLADDKVIPVELDATNNSEVTDLMSRCGAAISCVNYHHNYELSKAALESGSSLVDLGGNDDIVAKQFLLDELAKERGITIIPNLGLAPGVVSLLAVTAAEAFDELYEIRLRVGGVPIDPEGLFMGYAQSFAMDGLINEYVEDVTVIRDGQLMRLPSLSGLEPIEFPKPFGVMEAFSTSGGISTMPLTYEGKIQNMDYKTIRYPGHCEKIKLLKDLGLMSSEPVQLANLQVQPRELLSHLLSEKLKQDEPDAVLVRVVVTGVKDKKPSQVVWDCVDYNNQADGLTAMMRMTAFPASIIAQMIARGDIAQRGVLRQETVVPVKLFLAELASRGINLTMSERAPVAHS
jgi:lysine 6-dehydrogenase